MAALVAGLLGSCGRTDPPSLVGLEVWEGHLTDRGMPMLQRRIDPAADGGFVLRRDILHVARVTVRTSGQADRCLFRPFFYSWTPGSREYECYAEAQDGSMTIDVPFSTRTIDITRAAEYYVLVQLREHDAGRKLIGVYDTRRYPVTFSDP